MKNKQNLDKHAKEILRKILLGETLEVIGEEYQVDKNVIIDYYRRIFEKDERSLEIFNNVLEEEAKIQFRNNIIKNINGEITLKQAAAGLGIHCQTFKKRMMEYLATNNELLKLYETNKGRNDYSHIDFMELVIEMLENKCTQIEMEEKYQLKAKTLSKKIAGFKDKRLCEACKILAESFAYKRALSNDEINYINSVIKEHREDREIEAEK